METVDLSKIRKKENEISLQKILVKNVLVKGKAPEDIEVELIPFDPYNNDHVEFAYAYSDMLYRAPSIYPNVSEVSKAFVKLFMVHTSEDEKDPESKFCKIYNDLRAARSLFNNENNQLALTSFFTNA